MNRTVSEQSAAIFKKYLELNKRDRKDLMEAKAYDLAIKLSKATPVATSARIKKDVEGLGWELKGHIFNPKTPLQRRFLDRFKDILEQMLKRQPGESKDAPLLRLQKFVISARILARYYFMSGWLPAFYRQRGKGSEREPVLKANQKRRGLVNIVESGQNTIVTITNATDGIVALENKRPFVDKAIKAWNDDMIKYIAAKISGRSGKTVGGAS